MSPNSQHYYIQHILLLTYLYVVHSSILHHITAPQCRQVKCRRFTVGIYSREEDPAMISKFLSIPIMFFLLGCQYQTYEEQYVISWCLIISATLHPVNSVWFANVFSAPQYEDQLISPKQFVHISGKATLKDWKRAIRMGGVMLR